MHKFITRTDVITRDFGGGKAAASFAQKVVGRDAVAVRRDGDVFWMLPADAPAFGGEVVNTAADLRSREKAQKDAAQRASNEFFLNKAGDDARRVRHVKFGEGTVISDDAKAVTVLFDKQKKPMRMVASVLENL